MRVERPSPKRAGRWRRVPLALASLTAVGCAIDLDPAEGEPRPRQTPALDVCRPFSDVARALEGRLVAATLPDGRALIASADADVAGARGPRGFVVPALAGCVTGATPLDASPLIDTTPLGDGLVGHPRSALVAGGDTYLYFSADFAGNFGTYGGAIARWDAGREQFVALALLWTSDRPSYGNGAIEADGYAYLYGGRAARFLAADVFLARVPLDAVAERARYEYWIGGGNWSSDADRAAALVEGGTAPHVAWHPGRARFVMLYATPLSDVITIRSGFGPTGPWSAAYTLGACDLPRGGFCGEVTLLPSSDAGRDLALTHSVASFDRAPDADALDYWTRLARAPWPDVLP